MGLQWDLALGSMLLSSLVNTLPITKKNKHTVVTEAPKKNTCAAFFLSHPRGGLDLVTNRLAQANFLQKANSQFSKDNYLGQRLRWRGEVHRKAIVMIVQQGGKTALEVTWRRAPRLWRSQVRKKEFWGCGDSILNFDSAAKSSSCMGKFLTGLRA